MTNFPTLIFIERKDVLESIHNRHSGLVFSLALHMLRERSIAEEVAQYVFPHIWRLGSSYKKRKGKVAAWITGITHNCCIDLIRKRRGAMAKVQQVIDDRPNLTSKEPDPLDQAVAVFDPEQLVGVMEVLSSDQRGCIPGLLLRLHSFGNIKTSKSTPWYRQDPH